VAQAAAMKKSSLAHARAMMSVGHYLISLPAGRVGALKWRFQAKLLVFGYPTCQHLPCELRKCFPRVILLHGGHLWKQQCPFKDKPRDDDDDV